MFTPDARFIGPDRAWMSQPVPIARAVRSTDLAPLSVDWLADPVGRISIALVAVKAGAHPIDRANWVWTPELSWVTVRRQSKLDEGARRMVAGLGLVALGTVAIVFRYAMVRA